MATSVSRADAIDAYQLSEDAVRFEARGIECLQAAWRSDPWTYDVLVRAVIGDRGDASAYDDPTDEQLGHLTARLVEKLRAGCADPVIQH